jgi:hypothetical protein
MIDDPTGVVKSGSLACEQGVFHILQHNLHQTAPLAEGQNGNITWRGGSDCYPNI